MPRLASVFLAFFASVVFGAPLSAQAPQEQPFEYAPTAVLEPINGIADLQQFGGVVKVFARGTRSGDPDVNFAMLVWKSNFAGFGQIERQRNSLYWSESSPESNISRIYISDHWPEGSRSTSLTWSKQDKHWHGEEKFYGKRNQAPVLDYDRLGKAAMAAYLIVRNDYIANVAEYRQAQADKEMAEQRVLAEKAAAEAKAQAELETKRQAEIEAENRAYEAEEKKRLAKLQPFLAKRKSIGDYVCAASGNSLGYVERIEGNRIQIRVRHGEYDMIWKPYNTVYVCDSGN